MAIIPRGGRLQGDRNYSTRERAGSLINTERPTTGRAQGVKFREHPTTGPLHLMRLQYRLNFGDYLLFQAVHQFRSIPLQAMYLLFAWIIYATEVEKSGRLVGLIAAIVMYVVLWAFQLVFNVAYLYSSKNKSVLTEHIIELQDEAFYEETPLNRSFHYWPGIAKLMKGPGFVAVYVSAHQAHVIPNRAFASEQQRNNFYRLVKQRMRASKPAAQST
jgi:hypothetical protein